jgi:hypothetical protein
MTLRFSRPSELAIEPLPPLRSTARKEDATVLEQALQLARSLEELLEDTSSVAAGSAAANGAHSTRIVRAMAASLVDELEALTRNARKTDAA